MGKKKSKKKAFKEAIKEEAAGGKGNKSSGKAVSIGVVTGVLIAAAVAFILFGGGPSSGFATNCRPRPTIPSSTIYSVEFTCLKSKMTKRKRLSRKLTTGMV